MEEGAKNKRKLKEIEDQILQTLQETDDILGSSEAIKILSDAKIVSDDIKVKQEIADQTEKNIDEARLEYKPVAE